MHRLVGMLVIVSLLLAACGKQAAAPAAKDAPAEKGVQSAGGKGDKSDTEGVKLTAEEVSKLDLETEPAAATNYSREIAGYGVIISHDAIAQAASEIDTAQATARLSESALARARRLEGTAGAISADAVDALAQKAAVDDSALRLTRQKLSAVYGMNPPWSRAAGGAVLKQAADGSSKLLRATFPLGALSGAAPRHLRVRHLYADTAQNDWQLKDVWNAPADAAAPGRSFFALVKAPDAEEGERLQVWAPIEDSVSGVVIPNAAVVMSEGKFWCYVEKEGNTFVRVELDPARVSGDGYFLEEGVKAGDRVVVKSAGQLLAKETGSTDEASD